MRSLTLIHPVIADKDPGVPLRLKPFKGLTEKMSSSIWKGFLSIAVLSAVLSLAPKGMAMSPGAVGPGVAHLQSTLGIPADGIYGPQTAFAVAAYQRACGLLVDGIAGPQTLSALSAGACLGGGYQSSGPYYSHSSGYSQASSDYSHSSDDYPGPPDYSYTKAPVYVQPGQNQPPYDGYIVVIPGNDPQLLQAVRQYGFPQAAIDGTDAGPYINVGTYPKRLDAVYVANRLKGFGFPARVADRGNLQDQSR